jgi:hypothetical protein
MLIFGLCGGFSNINTHQAGSLKLDLDLEGTIGMLDLQLEKHPISMTAVSEA